MPAVSPSRNPALPVGAPLPLAPYRPGTEAARFGVPGVRTLWGANAYVQGQLTGIRLNAPNTGYPDGVGTKPSYAAQVTTINAEAPPVGFVFRVSLRVRGVFERVGFTGGIVQSGGQSVLNPSNATTDGKEVTVELSGTGWSTTVYRLNHLAGPAVVNPIAAVDYVLTFDLPRATTMSFRIYGPVMRQRDNTAEQVTLAGLPPYPGYYAGQFAQFDATVLLADPTTNPLIDETEGYILID